MKSKPFLISIWTSIRQRYRDKNESKARNSSTIIPINTKAHGNTISNNSSTNPTNIYPAQVTQFIIQVQEHVTLDRSQGIQRCMHTRRHNINLSTNSSTLFQCNNNRIIHTNPRLKTRLRNKYYWRGSFQSSPEFMKYRSPLRNRVYESNMLNPQQFELKLRFLVHLYFFAA